MAVLRFFMILILTVCFGCAKANYNTHLSEYDAGGVALWKPCTKSQADSLAAGGKDGNVLQSAACSAWLLESGTVKSADYAAQSQDLLNRYLKNNPDSGLGHYLLAYLVAKEAQLAPLKGLELVPVLEKEALLASRLAPEVDYGGPARMLGALYLKAPSHPISVGDLGKSLEYYEKAVKEAPDFALNHLGLAAALLEDDEAGKACIQLETARKSKSFNAELLNDAAGDKLVKACKKTCRDEK